MKFTDLTEEQQKFSTIRNQHVLALAAAGSGKTMSLIFFINDKIQSGVKPNEIISFSFTRKAANELKERINKFFENQKIDFKYISTIHSFCWNELIKPFYKEIGYTVVPTIVHEFPESFMDDEYKKYGKKKERASFNKSFMDVVTKDLQKEDFEKPETARMLGYLVEHNLVMFDFMIHLANFVLEDKESVENVKKTLGTIKYVIIDEAQDLNHAQYKFSKLLQCLFSE